MRAELEKKNLEAKGEAGKLAVQNRRQELHRASVRRARPDSCSAPSRPAISARLLTDDGAAGLARAGRDQRADQSDRPVQSAARAASGHRGRRDRHRRAQRGRSRAHQARRGRQPSAARRKRKRQRRPPPTRRPCSSRIRSEEGRPQEAPPNPRPRQRRRTNKDYALPSPQSAGRVDLQLLRRLQSGWGLFRGVCGDGRAVSRTGRTRTRFAHRARYSSSFGCFVVGRLGLLAFTSEEVSAGLASAAAGF